MADNFSTFATRFGGRWGWVIQVQEDIEKG